MTARTTPRTARRRTRQRIALAALLPLALLTALTGCAESAANDGAETGTLRIGVIGSKAQLTGPVGYLHHRDELLPRLAELGFDDIEVFPFPNGPDLNQALVGGSLDVASYGDTPALVARGSGLETRLIAQAQVGNDASIVVRDDGPRSIEELEGERVSVQTGSYIHRYLLGALRDAGVEPAEVPHIYTADTEAPLERGDVAAAAMPQVNAEVFVAKGYRIIDHLAEDHPDYAGTSATVSTESFLDENPDFAAAWQEWQDEGVRLAREDFASYQDFAVTLSDFPEELVRATTLEEHLPDGPFPERGLELLAGTKEFLVEEDFIAEDFDLEDWLVRTEGN
ncbi:PhnD/SsuA/transferrin family substrate-binding protein [Streptomyces sp. 3MP-14]|uniref:PhnD/SsuA/transferrin family substrate-binding protein n=1 Tax=Streptomyces mimosae TaxID=2586635 RepID=A0A5N5ZN31_9ACTN|nr:MULTISPECIES: ABC transporter substrate-binding protein [Streptomyces]KAB8157907.1 PhnD/SsuA/transferrin family substrate-binding protein [Streptomyces mimosae]KAB8172408.1 PhnD/SsuA/transferrin family substrate-binding protein [Streptomyces sp. 3MP-14]